LITKLQNHKVVALYRQRKAALSWIIQLFGDSVQVFVSIWLVVVLLFGLTRLRTDSLPWKLHRTSSAVPGLVEGLLWLLWRWFLFFLQFLCKLCVENLDA